MEFVQRLFRRIRMRKGAKLGEHLVFSVLLGGRHFFFYRRWKS